MITVFLVAILLGLFLGSLTKDGDWVVLGFLLGLLLGFIVAVLLGFGVSPNATVMVSQPLEQLSVSQGEKGVFFLESNEAAENYIYVTGGEIRSVERTKAEVVFIQSGEPRIDYVQYELPKNQRWMMLFAVTSFPSDVVIFYVPQGTVYVISE